MNLNGMLEAATNAATSISLYDIKAGIRKIQNVVMNLSEIEAKVREATNNEPWGASSSLMQEIANATYDPRPGALEDIMRMVENRFQEKSAEQWRQIYKALQLLEYLVINGSERVIDNAKATFHVYTKTGDDRTADDGSDQSSSQHRSRNTRKSHGMLSHLQRFQYIDDNGKDQGSGVRERAKIVEDLLWNIDSLRKARKKARENRGKYTGVQGGVGFGGGLSSSGSGSGSGSSSRFGGFGGNDSFGNARSSDFGGSSRVVYGDGGGFGGESESRATYEQSGKFEEYDEFEEGSRPAAQPNRSPRTKPTTTERVGVQKTTRPAQKLPEEDLVSFDEPAATSTLGTPVQSTTSALGSLSISSDADDEFDDFQSATPSTNTGFAQFAAGNLPAPITSTVDGAQFAAPKPVSAPQQANLSGMVGLASISPPPAGSASTPVLGSTNAPAFGSMNTSAVKAPAFNNANIGFSPVSSTAAQPPKPTAAFQVASPNYFQSVQMPSQQIGSPTTRVSAPVGSGASKPTASGDAFGALWAQASGTKRTATSSASPAIGQLAKEKSSASIWGTPTATPAVTPAPGKPTSQPTTSMQPVGSSTGRGNGLDDLLG